MCTFKKTQLMVHNEYYFLCNYNELKTNKKILHHLMDAEAKLNSFPNAIKV